MPLTHPNERLEANSMQAVLDTTQGDDAPLQLVLCVDKRSSIREQVRQVRSYLKELQANCPFELQVIDVSEYPYLAEHYRLIATPALIKTYPEPRHILAGSTLVEQLKHWWPQWKRSADELQINLDSRPGKALPVEPSEAEGVGFQATNLTDRIKEESGVRAFSPSVSSVAEGSVLPPSIHSITRSADQIRLADEVFRLQREKEGLEHQLQFKDQIISMLAHDLRNPLTATAIALETLEMGHDAETGWADRLTPAITAQLLKHARTQTRAIDRMITDILQAARGANSELRIVPQKLDLGLLCLEVVETLQDRFRAKSQTVEKDIPSDLPMVLADGERVRQVLTNLFDNAAKYSPVGGVITISALHRTTQKVQVSICDNGPGIPDEKREQIFEDRYRLERDEQQEGYGIGLSLCQRIVRAHYGQIWVDSSPGRGSCFHFTLPVFRG
ncbi:MAG: histidine kinase [Leptolyngbyaceae cyanobacterium]